MILPSSVTIQYGVLNPITTNTADTTNIDNPKADHVVSLPILTP